MATVSAPARPGRAARLKKGVQIFRSITINRNIEECYRVFRNFQNAPCYIPRLTSIGPINPTKWHCVSRLQNDKTAEWNIDITNEQAPLLVEWRTEEGAPMTHAGSVRFEPATGGRGTVMYCAFEYDRPMGRSIIAKISGQDPTVCEIVQSLDRFRSLVETGEIATVAGQPHGSEK